MERAVKTVQPFEFRSDFASPAEPVIARDVEPAPEQIRDVAPFDDGAIRLTATELAQILAEARAEGIAEQQRLSGADDGMITLSAAELADLLSDARAEGLAERKQVEAIDDGMVKLPAPDLSDMLIEARAEGLAEGLARQKLEGHDRLQLVTSKLNQALANLVALAGHLEATANDPVCAETSIKLINAAAQRIIDGQGDLFTELDVESPTNDRATDNLPESDEVLK